jgi:replication-associated recombination protein RarA
MTNKRYSMPETGHGLSAHECISAMQKCIRRSMEREAMEFAVELIHTSKSYCTMVCNRLEIISHEDIDSMRAPHSVRESRRRASAAMVRRQERQPRQKPHGGRERDPHDVQSAEVA